MRPETFGRALGIGARLLGQRVLAARPNPSANSQAQTETPRPAPRSALGTDLRARRSQQGQALGQAVRRVPTGTRNFGRAVWNPFAQAGRVLWLEVTGAFFLIFALLFANHLWTIRLAWRAGPEHPRFLIYAALSALFAYFAVSSFVRSRKR